MRLIDADELLQKIECLFKDLNCFENFMYNHGVGDCIVTIKYAPTIEADIKCEDCKTIIALKAALEPVKHGRWTPVTNGRGGFECSICHNYAPSYQDGVEWLSLYCPNCGAKMEGEEADG